MSYTNDTEYTVYANVTTLYATVLGLTPNTNYKFTVQAQNVIGVGIQATPILVKTLNIDPNASLTVPSMPVSFLYIETNTNATQIELSWQAPQSDGGTPIIDYTLWSDAGSLSPIAFNLTSTSYTVGGLRKGSTYQFKVSARNAVGQSPFSLPISVTAA